MKITTCQSELEAKKQAASRLSELVNSALDKKEPVLLLLSGGSSLGVLEYVDSLRFTSEITAIVTDERFDPSGLNNNFKQITSTSFYYTAVDLGVNFIDTSYKDGQTVVGLGNVMEHVLSNWIKQHGNGRVISTVGVGSDGHVCGMMPYPEAPEKFAEYFESKRFAIGYDAGNKNEFPLRATVTMTFLKHVHQFVGFAAGESKRIPLKKMMTNGRISEIPARVLKDAPGEIFTDVIV